MRTVLNVDDEKDVEENENENKMRMMMRRRRKRMMMRRRKKRRRMVTTWTLPSSGNTPRLPVLMLPKLLMP